MIPSPPRRAGNAIRSLILSLKEFWPVNVGRCFRMVSSSGCKRSLMSEIVRARNVHLLAKPCVKAGYAACGCESAIRLRCLRVV